MKKMSIVSETTVLIFQQLSMTLLYSQLQQTLWSRRCFVSHRARFFSRRPSVLVECLEPKPSHT